jgi:hypothetical protein
VLQCTTHKYTSQVPYYTVPPSEDDASSRKQTSGVQIMNGFSPEFDPLAMEQHDNEVTMKMLHDTLVVS